MLTILRIICSKASILDSLKGRPGFSKNVMVTHICKSFQEKTPVLENNNLSNLHSTPEMMEKNPRLFCNMRITSILMYDVDILVFICLTNCIEKNLYSFATVYYFRPS